MACWLVAAVPAAVAEKAPPMGWATFRNGPANTGVSAVNLRGTGPKSMREPFEFATKGLIWGSAVLDAEGQAYVGSADKTFYALDPRGRERWRYMIFDRPDSLIDSAAALTPTGLVVVPGGDGYLHALDRRTGQQRWIFRAHHSDVAKNQSGVVVNSFEGNVQVGPNGWIYAGSDNGSLYALDANGKEQWSLHTGMMVWSSPAFDPQNRWLAFGSLDGYLYLADPATGRVFDRFKAGGDVKASPCTDGEGHLYVGAGDGRFSAFDVEQTATGFSLVPKWHHLTGGEVYASAACWRDRLIIASMDGKVNALSKDGRLLWTYDTHSRVAASPALSADGVVLFGARNGKLYALDALTGERIWSFTTSDALIKSNLDASPAIGPDGTIFVGSYAGRIHGVPFAFPASHPRDPRCAFGGTEDLPDVGPALATDGATLRYQDRRGRFLAMPTRPVGLAETLRLRLVPWADGRAVEGMAINPGGLDVSIEPPVPMESILSSDGHFVNVSPKAFFEPDTRYRLKVTGRYRRKTENWLVDRLLGFGHADFSAEIPFTTSDAGKPPANSAATWGIKGLFLFQPEALETYIPAALDGQAFLVVGFGGTDEGRSLMLGLPALPMADEVRLLPEPSKVFVLEAQARGAWLRGEGKFRLAAMGGEIPFERFTFAGRQTPAGGLVDGEITALAPVLGINGNGTTFNFPPALVNEITDHSLRIVAQGTFDGTGVPERKAPRLVEPPRFEKDGMVLVQTAEPVRGNHLLVAVSYQEDGARLVTHGALRAGTTPGAFKWRIPLASTRRGDRLAVFWDGLPI